MTQQARPSVSDAAYDLAQLRRACQAHGLAAAQLEPLPQLGISNVLYLVDGQYCLRLPGPMNWARWSIHMEAIGVPLAAAAGVATPRLHTSDLTGELIEAPFLIYEWVPGRPLSDLPTDDPAVRPVFVSLGRDLARLHSREVPPNTLLDRPGLDPRELLERSATSTRPTC
jgi:aminoglycoside phosphotransferase (APT) family kinase protein